MNLYCHRCGNPMPDSARFCSACGAAINAVPPSPVSPLRPLVRPIAGRQIAGVCVGLARCYGWDTAVVRVIAVLVFFCSAGTAGVAYLACWIGIPEEMPTLP